MGKMNEVKLVWKTVSGDFPELVWKFHEIVQFVDNWKMKTLCTVGVSVASSVAMAVSCGFIARAQLNGVSVFLKFMVWFRGNDPN
ncbi:hypothetical protein ACE6H2_010093 [Prunus campanulata]